MGGGIGQYALYRAEDGSLCLFSLVVPAGSATPVHDHLAWGLVGIYRGRQDETVYRRLDDGRDPARAQLEIAKRQQLGRGEFYALLPPTDDIHYVTTISDTPSISIHLLANDTACVWRHRFDPGDRPRHAVPIRLRERALSAEMHWRADVVYLVDVDNTLLDNDAVIADLQSASARCVRR